MSSEGEQPATPQGRFWDERPCPRDACDGELQHQGNHNVMCINCEAAWMHISTQKHEQLVDMEFDAVVKRPRLLADGGTETDIPTADPATEPEYVGAMSKIVGEECADYVGETVEELEKCGEEATHTVVIFDGSSLAKIPMCNEHGEPEDVTAHDREWSGEVEL